jgi:hypothetical protein
MYLDGFSTVQDQATYLQQSATADALSLTVADTTALSRGLLEIEDELIQVDTIDAGSSTLIIPPYGRGFRSTTAAAHAAGTRVVSSPMFPRFLVKQSINDAIQGVFPDLYGTASTEFAFSAAVTTYGLPVGADDIIHLSWQQIGPSQEWAPIRRFRVDKNADTTLFPSGVTVSLYDMIVPGRTVRVTYTKQPTVLANNTDVFSTVTGLPSSCEDVIRLGAAYRLVPYFDAAHLAGMSAEADFSANMRPTGGATQMGKYLLQLYQIRLAEEARKLQNVFPNRSYYTR